MRLGDLARGMGAAPAASAEVAILDLAEDSRLVAPGALFIARSGTATHGGRFIHEAIARGAVAVLTDERTAVPAGVPVVRASDAAGAAGVIAERFFGDPSRDLKLVAVTGTNGKTTTAHLLQQILAMSGVRAGLIGTIHIDDGAARTRASLTTPGAVELSRTLARMVAHGCAACAQEASSHAIEQRRLDALDINAAIFTNLTGDHLDYHGSMDAYAGAKARLFEGLGADAIAVVNTDDPNAERMTRAVRARVVRCSALDESADVFARGGERTIAGQEVSARGPWGTLRGRLRLLGAHNLMNMIEALAAAHALGAEVAVMDDRLDALTAPPGRLEPVAAPDGAPAPTVLVDYAHTDDALAHALAAVRPIVPDGGRLWVVFGCGGDRDRAKRPRMGAVAARLADRLVITSDNPRSEEPGSIIDMIRAGVGAAARDRVLVQENRARAIECAIAGADGRDVVLLAGKGHEDYQIISDGAGGVTRIDFDDRLVARSALERRCATPARAP